MDAESARHAAAVQECEAVRVRLAAEVQAYTDAIKAEAALHVLNVAAIAKEALLADLGAEAGAGIAAAATAEAATAATAEAATAEAATAATADEETESETEAPKRVKRRKFEPAALIGRTIKYNDNELEVLNYVPVDQSPVKLALYDVKNKTSGKNSRMSAAVLISEFKKN
jgi:hypothetical protein